MNTWRLKINFLGITDGRVHVGYRSGSGTIHRISLAIVDGEAPASQVESVIEVLPRLAGDAVANGFLRDVRISVAKTSSTSFTEWPGAIRSYVERPMDKDDLPDRLRFALAAAYYDVVFPEETKATHCPAGLPSCPIADTE